MTTSNQAEITNLRQSAIANNPDWYIRESLI